MSPVTTLSTARTVDPGDFEVAGGASFPIHGAWVSGASKLVLESEDRASSAESEPLSEQEEREYRRAIMAILLLQPSLTPEATARAGVVDGVDLGFRYAGASLKLDAKYNFLHAETYDLALTGGYVHHTGIGKSFAGIAYDLLEYAELVKYSRRDIDAAFLISGDPREWLSGYGALRYVAGFTRVDTTLPEDWVMDRKLEQRTQTVLHYIGPTGGLRLGTERVAMLAELSVMWLFLEPTVLGERVDLGGLVVSPALGVHARF